MAASSSMPLPNGSLSKHGYPRGFRFVPTSLELFSILSDRIHGRSLPRQVKGVFRELSILDFHPSELCDEHKALAEQRYIYFFSRREFQKQVAPADDDGSSGGAVQRKRQRGKARSGKDDVYDDAKEPRPVRMARCGGWKASGGGQLMRWPRDKGGFVAGRMVTMVFYEHNEGGDPIKSDWGMHEFTIPVNQSLLSNPTKHTRFYDLALYRLYIINCEDLEGDIVAWQRNQALAANHLLAVAPFPACHGQPSSSGIQPLATTAAAAASTSQMMPQQQHLIPIAGPHAQYQYYHHHYTFGAAATSAGHQQVHTMPPVAYGTGLPGHQLLQFAGPPAPAPMPVPPAAANPVSSLSHQAPAKATCDAGQETCHPGATRLPPSSAPVSAPPQPAAETPPAGKLAPTAATYVAGQGAGHLGATRSPPAAGITQAEQHAATTTEPGQFADCVKPMEVAVPPPPPLEDEGIVPAAQDDEHIPDADNYDGLMGLMDLDWHFGVGCELFDNDRFQFTMDEIYGYPTSDESPPTQGGNNSSGTETTS